MKVVDIADSLYRSDEINQDTLVSIPSISAWLRFGKNLGSLNNLINTRFVIDDNTLEIIDDDSQEEIGELETAIYCQLYFISYFNRKISTSLGVAGVDILQSAESDQGKLTFINRNEIAKTYNMQKKDIQDGLNKLINSYKRNAYSPKSVESDDQILIGNFPQRQNSRIRDYYGGY